MLLVQVLQALAQLLAVVHGAGDEMSARLDYCLACQLHALVQQGLLTLRWHQVQQAVLRLQHVLQHAQGHHHACHLYEASAHCVD